MAVTLKLASKPIPHIDTTPVVKSMQSALFNTLRGHFNTKNAQGNKQGWWRSNFWHKEVYAHTARGTLTAIRATVNVSSRPYRHKIEGGPIVPLNAQALAIPNNSEAKQMGSPGLQKNPLIRYVPLKSTINPNLVGMLVMDEKTKKPKTKAAKLEASQSSNKGSNKMRAYMGEGYRPKKSRIQNRKLAKKKADRDSKAKVYWWLVKMVDQKADPTAEPPPGAIETSVKIARDAGMAKVLKRL